MHFPTSFRDLYSPSVSRRCVPRVRVALRMCPSDVHVVPYCRAFAVHPVRVYRTASVSRRTHDTALACKSPSLPSGPFVTVRRVRPKTHFTSETTRRDVRRLLTSSHVSHYITRALRMIVILNGPQSRDAVGKPESSHSATIRHRVHSDGRAHASATAAQCGGRRSLLYYNYLCRRYDRHASFSG